MSLLKKILSVSLVCAMLLSLLACGEYKPSQGGVNNGGGNNGGGNSGNFPDDSDDQPTLDDDPTNDFTVQLRVNEQPFVPTVSMSVYWNDGYNIHIAPVDRTGRAVIDGLDGDYRVTLSTVPSGYAYDPNAYLATNDNRNLIIDMYDLNILRGSGTDLYECYQISETGVYTVTVTEPGQLCYVQFAPQTNGTYTVESWVNTVDDEVSPICMGYLGTSQFKYGQYKVTSVGLCGSYTRNFIHTVNIADENISTGGGGSQTFTFAVTAETKSGVYPVNLTFAIKRNGGFDLNRTEKIVMFPQHDWSAFDFNAFEALAGGNIVGAETLYPNTTDNYMFDEDNYKVWNVSEGGDGVYHVYDPDKYSETGGYGPVLVAYITEACRFIDRSFTTIEDAGNNALIVNGNQNYRLFIEGFAALAEAGYYCVTDCICHLDGSTLACLAGCPDCSKDCTPATAAEMAVKGYADLVNADGVAPVTPELKEFLQSFSITRGYFADGEGWVETNSQNPIDSYEDSQWLFACGYYE